MVDIAGQSSKSNNLNLHLPTEQSCDDFKLRRWPKNYKALKSKSNTTGLFNKLASSLIDVETPEFDPRFLSGPQFENKPANIGQQLGAQYSFGYYNGEKSKWFESKEGKEIDPSMDRTHLTNSVTLEILSNTVPKVKHQKAQNGKNTIITTTYDRTSAPISLGKINILPNLNEEGIGFDHNHSYGKQDDIVTNLLTSIGGLIGGASNTIDALSKAVNGYTKPEERSGPKPITKIDIADTYQSTDKLSITLPFTLFTKNNFIRDIFGPIMLLNVISHPKRSNIHVFDDIAKAFGTVARTFSNRAEADIQKDEETIRSGGEKTADALNSVIPGFRLFSSLPPSYINVTHSTGLFSLKNCVITSFSYKYKGPWISSIDNGSAGGGAGSNPAQGHTPWWKFWLPKKDILDSEFSDVTPKAWPSFAECSITLKSVDPLFADDYASLLDDAINKNWSGSSGEIRDGVSRVITANGGFGG